MKPSKKWDHWNSKRGDVPVFQTKLVYYSKWTAGLWERLVFLITGQVWVNTAIHYPDQLAVTVGPGGHPKIAEPHKDAGKLYGVNTRKDGVKVACHCMDCTGVKRELQGPMKPKDFYAEYDVGKLAFRPGLVVGLQKQPGIWICDNDGNLWKIKTGKRK